MCKRCGEDSPAEFTKNDVNGWCRSCRSEASLKTNAVKMMSYRVAGGLTEAEYYRLPKDDRRGYRDTAKQLVELGADFATAQRAEKTDKRGFVYIITHPRFPGYVKIGRAFDPEARLNGYQTGCPERAYKLDFACYFEDCHATEKYIHSWLADYRASGEWFRILPSTAESLIYELMEAGYVG